MSYYENVSKELSKILGATIFEILIPITIISILMAILIGIIIKILQKIKFKNIYSKDDKRIKKEDEKVYKEKVELIKNDVEVKINNDKKWEFKKYRGGVSEKTTAMQLNEFSKFPIIQDAIIKGYNDYTCEIDMICINDCGIFVIENKSYSGRIIGKQEEYKWTQILNQKTKTKFYNPIMQNETHIKVLKGQLKTNSNIPYFNVIVFGGNIDISDIQKDDNVVLATRASVKVELYKLINKSKKF